MAERRNVKDFIIKYNAVFILIVLIIISTILSPVFLTANNIFNILRQNTPILLISMGMLLVILTGGIDLSVGSIAAVGGMMISLTLVLWKMASPLGLVVSILLTLLSGVLLGAISGVLVSYANMAPFVVTLAMMTIARGIGYLITNGQPVRWSESTTGVNLMLDFGSETLLGIPYPVILAVIACVIFVFLTKYTMTGRLIIAIGSNESAVMLAGINSKRYKFLVYAVSGFMSALGGIVMACRSGTGTPMSGAGYELDAIAACVIGGASLSGGKGGVGNTIIGVLVLGLIANIMNLLSVPAYPQEIIKGIIILFAVLVQSLGSKNRNTSAE
ncbi:MAG: ABC transporter permease [Blautia sp.]|jgi:ribose transport system permease protein